MSRLGSARPLRLESEREREQRLQAEPYDVESEQRVSAKLYGAAPRSEISVEARLAALSLEDGREVDRAGSLCISYGVFPEGGQSVKQEAWINLPLYELDGLVKLLGVVAEQARRDGLMRRPEQA